MPKQANIPNLRDWPDKRIVMPSGSHLQEAVDAIRGLSGGAADLQNFNPAGFLPVPRFPATIVTYGPNGESDYTDPRYWVYPSYIPAGKQTDLINFQPDSGNPVGIVTATNLAEWHAGTHSVSAQKQVWVEAWADYSTPQNVRYFFNLAPEAATGLTVDLTIVTGVTWNGTTNQLQQTTQVLHFQNGLLHSVDAPTTTTIETAGSC